MTEKEKLEYLSKQGINVKAGMRYADDSMEFYEQLIEIFLQEYEGKRQKAEIEYQNPGEKYTVLVHGLKNSTRYLGADALADMAFAHEKASKAGDISYIAENFETLLQMWEKTVLIFCTSITKYGK